LSARDKLYLDNDQVPPPLTNTQQRSGSGGHSAALGAHAARKRHRDHQNGSHNHSNNSNNNKNRKSNEEENKHPLLEDERLKFMDSAMVERILSEVLDHNPIGWDDIAGLKFAKLSVQEMVGPPSL
jgi:hypothetical protein